MQKNRGATRMREFGYQQVVLWLDASEYSLAKEAARRKSKKIATWIREIVAAASISDAVAPCVHPGVPKAEESDEDPDCISEG